MQMNGQQQATPNPVLSATWFYTAGVFALALWLLLCWPTLISMELVWRGSETYMHCYFIPAISLWLIWPLRQQINTQQFGSYFGLIALFASLTIWLVGFAADVNLIAHTGAISCLISILWCWLGNANFKLLRFPLLYLFFMVPFGEEANAPLQFVTAEMAVWLLQMSGIPVLHEGLYLTTPVGAFEVAEACSGVRFLIVALALACLFCHLNYRSWIKKLVFIAVLILFSIIANSFRAFFLIYLGESTNMAYGFGADHYFYGWVFFAVVILASFQIGARFADKEEEFTGSTTTTGDTQPKALVLSLLMLAGIAGWISMLTPVSPTVKTFVNQTQPLRPGLEPNHPYALTVTASMPQPNIGYYSASFAMRQSEGELISSENTLYDQKLWSLTDSKSVDIANSSLNRLLVTNGQGQRVVVLYRYQIGNMMMQSKAKAKMLQALYFLLGHQSLASIHVCFSEEAAEAQCQQLLAQSFSSSAEQ